VVDSTPVELRPIHLAWNPSFVTAARISLRANLAGVGPLKPDAVGPTNLDKLTLGTDATDAKGADLRTAAEPKEIPGFREAIHPRDHHVFFGALDPGRLTFAEKTVRKLPAARAMMPEGDFRDWTEIEDWARSIAEELAQLDAGHSAVDP